MNWNNFNPPTQEEIQQKQMQDMMEQMKAQSEQMKGFQDMFSSGNVMKAGDDGLLRIAGGKNRYGEVRPDFTTMQGTPGQLAEQFKESLGPSYAALQQKALAEGDTRGAQLARERQGLMSAQAMDQAARQQAGAGAQARSALAMKGGLTGGAAERLAQAGQSGLMRARQMQNTQDQMAGLQISAQDEAMKNQLLGQTGQAEQMVGGRNIDRLQKDIENQNKQRFGIYREDMQAYGAQQSANAQRAAADSGCIITTVLNETKEWTDKQKLKAVIWCRRTHHDGSLRGKMWVDGYHNWGGRFATVMRKNKPFRKVCKFLTQKFVSHVTGKKNLIGCVVKYLWVNPASYTLGFFMNLDELSCSLAKQK